MELQGIKNLGLSSITRQVQTGRTNADGTPETKTVTYKRGDPELDAYEAEVKKQFEKKQHDMWFGENGMPKNLVSYAMWSRCEPKITQPLFDSFERFYRGIDDEKSVEQTMSSLVANLKGYYTDQGYNPEEFMPSLIEDVYDIARMGNIRGVGIASLNESRALDTANRGFQRESKDSVYYNSDFYYSSEEMKGTLVSLTKKIATKYGVDPAKLELPTSYPEGDVRKGIYSSYNTIVAGDAFNKRRIGWMLDETMVPPKGLRFFYQGNTNGTNTLVPTLSAPRYDDGDSNFDGVVQIWYGDWSFTGRVPVRKNSYLYPISVNMFDAVTMNHPGEVPGEIVPFLKNWDFFDPGTSSLYEGTHTRKLP